MSDVWRRLAGDPRSRRTVALVTAFYLTAFLLSLGDLAIDGAVRPISATVAGGGAELMLRQRAPFQFEAVAVIGLPGAVLLLSPLNVATGLTLGLLTGVQIGLVGIARRCARACGLHPLSGLLSGLPGLFAGSACCAPILFLLLGLQVTTAVVTTISLIIPAAFVLLVAGLFVTARVAARRCALVPV